MHCSTLEPLCTARSLFTLDALLTLQVRQCNNAVNFTLLKHILTVCLSAKILHRPDLFQLYEAYTCIMFCQRCCLGDNRSFGIHVKTFQN